MKIIKNNIVNVKNPNTGSFEGVYGLVGANGKSAYEIAVEHGYNGTEEEWINSIRDNKEAIIESFTEEVNTIKNSIPASYDEALDIISSNQKSIITDASDANEYTQITYEISNDEVEVPTMDEFNALKARVEALEAAAGLN